MTSPINVKNNVLRKGFTPRKGTLSTRGFTLLELLIVISIIAILSVIVILVLNPSEMLKKARDSQRIADLTTIKKAIGLYLVGTNVPYLGLNGNSNTGCSAGSRYIWFSKSGVSGTVDTDATATSSASQSSAGKTNGTGWIPVNLGTLSGGSPISNWPVDPVNSVASLSAPALTDLVYRYGCNSASQFEVDATLESNAYTLGSDKRAVDGGDNPNLYETGTNLAIVKNLNVGGGSVSIRAGFPIVTSTPDGTLADLQSPPFSANAGDRLIATIGSYKNIPTSVTGTALTWSLVDVGLSDPSWKNRGAIYTAVVPAGGVTNETLMVRFGGVTHAAQIQVFAFDGASGSLGGHANAIGDSGPTATPIEVTLTASAPGSMVIGAFDTATDEGGGWPVARPDSFFYNIYDEGDGAASLALRNASNTTGAGNVTVGCTNSTQTWGAAAVEVLAGN